MDLAHRMHVLSGGRRKLQSLWQMVATSAQEVEPFLIVYIVIKVIYIGHISEVLSCQHLGEGIPDVFQPPELLLTISHAQSA